MFEGGFEFAREARFLEHREFNDVGVNAAAVFDDEGIAVVEEGDADGLDGVAEVMSGPDAEGAEGDAGGVVNLDVGVGSVGDEDHLAVGADGDLGGATGQGGPGGLDLSL